jgi:hypothetical protein
MSTKLLNPFLSDLSGKQRAETVPPETDSFMANINTAFVQQIFHISKRKWITHIHHNRQADDFGRRLEVLEWVAFCHSVKLDNRPARLNQVSSDSTSDCVPQVTASYDLKPIASDKLRVFHPVRLKSDSSDKSVQCQKDQFDQFSDPWSVSGSPIRVQLCAIFHRWFPFRSQS